jgi:hypothetical protein
MYVPNIDVLNFTKKNTTVLKSTDPKTVIVGDYVEGITMPNFKLYYRTTNNKNTIVLAQKQT